MGPPQRILPPLTSSTLPDVSRALATHQVSGSKPAPSPANSGRSGPILPFEEDAESPTVQVSEAVVPHQAPQSFTRGRYTLGQLIESVRQRKKQTRLAVESGDIDGPELDLPWIGGVR